MLGAKCCAVCEVKYFPPRAHGVPLIQNRIEILPTKNKFTTLKNRRSGHEIVQVAEELHTELKITISGIWQWRGLPRG